MDRLIADYEKAKQRLEELHRSPEYSQLCDYFATEIERLSKIAADLCTDPAKLKSNFESRVVRKEYATGCRHMHRGFYCPSPVQELFVSGIKRGRLLKRVTARTFPCHEYGFDRDGRLILCENLVSKTCGETVNLIVASREYLFYEEDRIYGVTIDSRSGLCCITEELFQEGKLICYSNVLCTSFDGAIQCHSITCERYCYNADGLRNCQLHQLTLPPKNIPEACQDYGLRISPHPVYQHNRYTFTQEGGKSVLTKE